jgi:hypothetical protein
MEALAMSDLVREQADIVEAVMDSGRSCGMRLTWLDPPRHVTINLHAAVLKELRRRGHHARGTTAWIREGELDPDGRVVPAGEYLMIGFEPDD